MLNKNYCGITYIYWQYVMLHMCALIGACRKLSKIADGCHGYILSTGSSMSARAAVIR